MNLKLEPIARVWVADRWEIAGCRVELLPWKNPHDGTTTIGLLGRRRNARGAALRWCSSRSVPPLRFVPWERLSGVGTDDRITREGTLRAGAPCTAPRYLGLVRRRIRVRCGVGRPGVCSAVALPRPRLDWKPKRSVPADIVDFPAVSWGSARSDRGRIGLARGRLWSRPEEDPMKRYILV
jgi:hypothetical protein